MKGNQVLSELDGDDGGTEGGCVSCQGTGEGTAEPRPGQRKALAMPHAPGPAFPSPAAQGSPPQNKTGL